MNAANLNYHDGTKEILLKPESRFVHERLVSDESTFSEILHTTFWNAFPLKYIFHFRSNLPEGCKGSSDKGLTQCNTPLN